MNSVHNTLLNSFYSDTAFMGIAENLKRLMDEHGDNPHSLGKAINVPQPNIFRIIEGIVKDPRRSTLEPIAKHYGITVDELVTGTKSRSASLDAHSVPLINAYGSMGQGNEQPDHEVVIDSLRVSKHWVDTHLTQISSIHNLAFIHAIGDSMSPTFNDGDILLVDTGTKTVNADKIYVLSAHGRLFIKRVRQRIDGAFEISSDNPTVKTTDILNGDHQVEVKGRVVWVWNGKRI